MTVLYLNMERNCGINMDYFEFRHLCDVVCD